MNVFNRIVMVLLILVALAVVLGFMLQPQVAIDLVRFNLGLLEDALQDSQFQFYMLVGLGVAAFVLLLLLWGELHRTRKKKVKIKTATGGKAQLGVQSVVQSLEYRIDELAGVRKVQPKVTSRGRDVEVRIDLDTSPSVNVPVLTGQIIDLCHDIVEGQLGVKIKGKVNVNVKHEPYPRGTMPPTAPLGEDAIKPPVQAEVSAEPQRMEMPTPVQAPTPAPAPAAEPMPAPEIEAEPLIYVPDAAATDEPDEDKD